MVSHPHLHPDSAADSPSPAPYLQVAAAELQVELAAVPQDSAQAEPAWADSVAALPVVEAAALQQVLVEALHYQ